MCGIAAIISKGGEAVQPAIVSILEKLENRGYDGAGLSIMDDLAESRRSSVAANCKSSRELSNAASSQAMLVLGTQGGAPMVVFPTRTPIRIFRPMA